MARTTVTENLPQELGIRERVTNCHQWVKDQLGVIESDDSPEHERLLVAFGCWQGYPLFKEWLVDGPLRETSDTEIRAKIRSTADLLNRTHIEAVYVLMRQADKTGGNSATIWQSGEHCRKLLELNLTKHYPHDRTDDFWPGCLHGSIYDLPADIRQSIQDGHAQVVRLGIQPNGQRDNRKNSENSLPQSPDVYELCRHLNAKLSNFATMIECARDFCRKSQTDESKAENLLRQAKRFRHLWPT